MESGESKVRRPLVAAKVAGSGGRIRKSQGGLRKLRVARKVILPTKSGSVTVTKIRKIIREDPELSLVGST